MAQSRGGCHHGGRGSEGDAGRIAEPVRFAAIIPAHRAESTIARTLLALLEDNRSCIGDIVVVTSSVDRTAEIAAGFPGVTVLRTEGVLSAGAARNLGRKAVPHAAWLLFVDSDCRPAPGALSSLGRLAIRQNLCAVGASVHREGGGPVGWATHLLEFKDFEADVSPVHPGLTPSATFLCRAEAFDDAGGFPDMWPGEDWVFCARLQKQQCRIDRDRAAVTFHAPPRSLRRFVSHQRRLGMTSAQARAQTGLPGAWFVRHPAAVPVLFLGRLARGLAWILRYRPMQVWFCLLCLPLYLAGLVSWTAGFAVVCLRLRRDGGECAMTK